MTLTNLTCAHLRESEARYRLVSENGTDVIWLFDFAANRFSYVSPSVERLRGFTPEEVRNQSMQEALAPASLELVNGALPGRLAAFIAGDESARTQTHEVIQTRKDGSTVTTEVVSTLIADGEGRVTHLQGVTRDITDRKRGEAALARATERLVLAQEAAGAGLWDWDMTTDQLSWSPELYKILGLDPNEVATLDLWRAALHRDDRQAAETRVMDAIRDGVRLTNEYRVVLPSGNVRWIEAIGDTVYGEDGNALRMSGICIDITERKRIAAERTALSEQLQQAQKLESVGRLAGGVAHDFNNMLAVILGHAELALERVSPGTPLHDSLMEMRQAASRSAELTRQLLAFARRQTVAPRVLDLNETVAGMVAMLQRLIGENIQLIWAPTVGLWPVRIDPSQVDQLLANLCINARDAISGVGHVTIELQNVVMDARRVTPRDDLAPGDYVRITVSDDGCGMNESTLAHVFEPFFTTKPIGRGTGLGLATVYGIAKQNGGGVAVRSQSGRGSTLWVDLPRHLGPSDPTTDDTTRPPVNRGTETILLVEDEPGVLNPDDPDAPKARILGRGRTIPRGGAEARGGARREHSAAGH